MTADRVIRRTLVLLGLAYGLGWFTAALVVGPGSAVFVELSGRLDFAGYFIAIYFAGVAAGGALIGRAMDRWGRRPLLAWSYAIAAAGFGLAGLAVRAEWLALFVAGDFVLAFGLGGTYLTRLAAAEMFPPAGRGRAVARIQLSALGGAVAGPLLLLFAEPLERVLGLDPSPYIWLVAPPVLLIGMALVLMGPETRDIARSLPARSDGPATAARPASLQLRPLLTGVASLAFAQAGMVMAMGVTGAALQHEGHDVGAVGLALAAHFLGMFGLSAVVGRLADRIGRRSTILWGLLLMVMGGALMAAVPGVPAFSTAIFLVGLGWSGAYIGGTVLIADATPLDRGARVLGLTDMVAAGLAVAASLSGGAWYATHRLPGLGLLAIAIIVVPAVLTWTLREARPGVYPVPMVPHP